MGDEEFDSYIRMPEKGRAQMKSRQINQKLQENRLQQTTEGDSITDEFIDPTIVEEARLQAMRFMLSRFERERQINRVIISSNNTIGYSLDD
mmetsp:Transcript_2427/g.2853  ORF Transcript_2427/g.2853 Transcript_2427/m.2853 type:complete len:92 (+) Transcript_2427:97-372(+)